MPPAVGPCRGRARPRSAAQEAASRSRVGGGPRADLVERQVVAVGAERLLDLLGEQLEPHRREEDEHARGDRPVAELAHEPEREHEAVEQHELLGVRAVRHRDRRVADAFAPAGDVVERDEQRRERDRRLARQRAGRDVAVHEPRQVAHDAVRDVRPRLAARPAQVRRERRRELAQERRVRPRCGAPAGSCASSWCESARVTFTSCPQSRRPSHHRS
jgi:hypothetical protein